MLLEIPDAKTSLEQSIEHKKDMDVARRLNAELRIQDAILGATLKGELSVCVDWYIVDIDLRKELENMGYKLKEEKALHGVRLRISWGDDNGSQA
jgi:hypothetical protein